MCRSLFTTIFRGSSAVLCAVTIPPADLRSLSLYYYAVCGRMCMSSVCVWCSCLSVICLWTLYFNTTVSNFRDWFRRIRIRMEPHDLRVGKPQTSAIVQLLAAQSFTKWGRMFLYFMEWYCLSVTYCIVFTLPKIVVYCKWISGFLRFLKVSD